MIIKIFTTLFLIDIIAAIVFTALGWETLSSIAFLILAVSVVLAIFITILRGIWANDDSADI